MADVNIGYEIKVNADTPAVNNFNNALSNTQRQLAATSPQVHAVNSTLFATNQVIRDLPFGFIAISNNLPVLVDNFTRLKLETGSVTESLKGMIAGFMGPAGISIAISAAISAITAFSLSQRGSTKTTEDHKKAVDDLADSIYKLRENLQKASIATLLTDLASIQSQMAEIDAKRPRQGTLGRIAGTITQDDIKRYEELKQQQTAVQEIMKNMGYLQAAENGLAEARIALTKARTEAQKVAAAEEIKYYDDIIQKENERLGLQDHRLSRYEKELEYLKKLRKQADEDAADVERDLMELIDKQNKKMTEPKPLEKQELSQFEKERIRLQEQADDKKQRSIILQDFESDAERKKRLKENNELLVASYQAAIDTIKGSFDGMWESVFGKANSLLEIFLQKLASGLAAKASSNILGGIFDTIIPGSGKIINEIFGSGQSVRSGGSNNVSYVVLDSQVIGTAVTKTLPQSVARNRRLGRVV